jgi:predicted O-methyltransferase YrrM
MQVAMEPLSSIASRYPTDKDEPGRRLLAAYEEMLGSRRHVPTRMLEIGIANGGSARMWLDYFDSVEIVAVDIEPDAANRAPANITVLVGDQGNERFLAELATHGPFDVVIDDGSHMSDHQIRGIKTLWPTVKPGGVYAVEDTHTSYFRRYDGGFRRPGTFMEFAKSLLDDPNQRWHEQPTTLPDLGEVRVYPELCVFVKQTEPFRGGPASPEVLRYLSEPRKG